MALNEGFVTWCSSCDWNLEPSKPRDANEPARSRAAQAKEQGERLFNLLSQRPIERPRISNERRLSFFLALLVHLLTLCVLAGGLVLLVTGLPSIATTVIGVLLILLAVLLRPHFGKLDRHDIRLARQEAPALYRLTDTVARLLGAEPASVIIIDGTFNAAHARIGLRRRPVLWLGLPLWDILSDGERVALLGHEFGHQVNGDPAYGFVVGSALRTLADWYRLLHPRFRWKRSRTIFDFVELVASAVGVAIIRALGLAIRALFRLERSLTFRSTQQAEYYADALGAGIASANTTAGLVDRLHLAKPCTQAIWFAMSRGKDPWIAEREFVASLPSNELERLRRIDALHGTAIDAIHPPTSLRVALLERNTASAARLTVSPEDAANIAAELDRVRPRVTERIGHM